MGGKFWKNWGRPLGAEEFKAKQEKIRQGASLEMLDAERAAAVIAQKDERGIRRTLRFFDRDLREAADILGGLQAAVAEGSREKFIKKNLRHWKGRIGKIESHKVRLGGYAGVIAKLLAETVGLIKVGNADDQLKTERKRLQVISRMILADLKSLETKISLVADKVRQVTTSTPVNDPLWASITTAVSEASKFVTKIHNDALGAMGLETEVRKRLERS